MLTEGIILSLDYNTNSCTVRIPIFETVGMTDSAIFEAKIAIQPGSFNNYKKDDMVWVGFINKKAQYPLVIGKIYQGPQEESEVVGGSVNIGSLSVSNNASIPQDTLLTGPESEFGSVSSIIKILKQSLKTIENQRERISKLENSLIESNAAIAGCTDKIKQLEESVNQNEFISKFIATDSEGNKLYDKDNELLITKDIDLAKGEK